MEDRLFTSLIIRNIHRDCFDIVPETFIEFVCVISKQIYSVDSNQTVDYVR